MNEKPIIGITYSDAAKRDNEMRVRTYCSRKYYMAIQNAGAEAILLPPVTDPESITRYLSLVDGLLFPGGGDVDPRFQNEDPSPKLGMVNPFRDEFEIKIAKEAYKKKVPSLGICRGLQVMTIALGGKVHQDISSFQKIQHSQNAPRWGTSHKVTIVENTLLKSLVKGSEIFTNSFHHQTVRKLPAKLIASAHTADGSIEGIESKDKRLFIGVQWHPEELVNSNIHSANLFKYFVEAVKKFM